MIYTPAVAEWFQGLDITVYATDTAGNELNPAPPGQPASPLHAALMRNLGVVFMELLWLEDLAKACADDGRYEGLFVAAPLKVVGGTGGPVNPVVIK
jgi:kynurenine formamidase